MSRLPKGELLSMREHSITYEDLVLAGMLADEWDALVAWCVEGLGQLEEQPCELAEVRTVAEGFRRERHLESGELLRAWLAERGLSVSEWESHVKRRCALGRIDLRARRSDVLPQGFDAALRVDSFCLRFWELGARRVTAWIAAAGLCGDAPRGVVDVQQLASAALLDDAAALSERGAGWCEEHLSRLASWSEAYDGLGNVVGTESAIERMVETHWSEWSSLQLDVCRFGSESAAREALVCAIEDGDTIEQIARRAHTDPEHLEVHAGDLEAHLGPMLLSATVDEPTGPLRLDSDWAVIWVRERKAPDPTDPLLRAEAVRALVDDAVDRERKGAVRWCAPV